MSTRKFATWAVIGLAGGLITAPTSAHAAPAAAPAAEAWRVFQAPSAEAWRVFQTPAAEAWRVFNAPSAEAWRVFQAPSAEAWRRFEAPAATPAAPARRSVSAPMHSSSGKRIGTATLRESGGRVLITVDARWVTTGFHGLHVHAIGKCEKNSTDPADSSKKGAFLSAGGHWNPTNVSHPDHHGDLGNVYADKRNRVNQTLVTDRFRVRDLFDSDGSALVLHAGADNFANVPDRKGGPDEETLKAGDAGGRAACAVLAR